jgi:[NiFe] hydrogenase diaphorase moiety large subunit
VLAGRGSSRDLDDLANLARVMRLTSHCGLGTTAGNPVVDALSKLRPSFERRLPLHAEYATFDLDEALAPAREATARDDAQAHLASETP